MANRFGSVFALVLALVMTLTSVTMAVSRTEAGVGHLVSVCSDGEVHLMRIGADGEPVAHDHSCPYCVLLNAMLDAPAVHERGAVTVRAAEVSAAVQQVRAEGGAGSAWARGPPAAA
ncbi:MAG: hypothetical protein H5U18_08335 [Rhodobacteraceae bacterium]|nr:hypothetical protein [Paracoccaceae bacterium]